jgi:hypothetical protein
MAGTKRRNKYGAKRVEYDGIWFDSQAECNHYCVLKLRQKQGEISNLEVHPKYELSINGRPILIRSEAYPNGRKALFRPDFRYTQEGRGVVVEDYKGMRTKDYVLRRAVFEAIYFPVVVDEISKSQSRRAGREG